MLDSKPFADMKKVMSSTKVKGGLDKLYKELSNALGIIPSEGVFSARRRHTLELEETIKSIDRAINILNNGDLVLCAQEVREAQDHLGTITGAVTSDDLLGKIFSTFCIGK